MCGATDGQGPGVHTEICEKGRKVYRSALTRGAVGRAEASECLTARGLLTPSMRGPDTLVPVPPSVAATAQTYPVEQAILVQQQRLASLRAAVSQVEGIYQEARQVGVPAVQRLVGPGRDQRGAGRGRTGPDHGAADRAARGSRPGEHAWERADAVSYQPDQRRPRLLTEKTRLRVLRLMVDGYTDGAIAGRLGMSTRTVASHLKKASDALGSNSRAQLAYLIARTGLLDDPLPDGSVADMAAGGSVPGGSVAGDDRDAASE
ncbi:response regulator transcription factor [Streptomyces sp. NPDC059452]|uniref:helix-turn-helix transcriptional regulator n=1 Tax=Streptomyces sp. NPDC059452 TaxID=3346835 RepID=UPI0036CDE55F